MGGTLDELSFLRPKVSKLEHDLASSRRRIIELMDRNTALEKECADLRNIVKNLRSDQQHTPPMGTAHIETDAVTRKNREHG